MCRRVHGRTLYCFFCWCNHSHMVLVTSIKAVDERLSRIRVEKDAFSDYLEYDLTVVHSGVSYHYKGEKESFVALQF
jgi:hypothetical protein